MTEPSTQRSSLDPHEVRMSIGDHLEDLRGHLIRALLGVVVGFIIGIVLAKPILEIIMQPVVTVLEANDLSPQVQVLNPQEPFITWVKVALFAGLIIAGPYALWEIWRFVAAGLYPRERKLVRRLIPPSLLLFIAGVLFFYFIVLPLVLNFFVSFAARLTTESVTPNAFQRLVTGAPDTKVVTTRPAGPQIPVLEGSPADPLPGDQWIDTAASQYRVATADGVYGMPLARIGEHQMVQSQYRLKEYISFVGMLALSFGAAFQMPVVVVFLAWAGIFSAAQMGSARKFVILGIVVGAAVLTPTPDAVSMSLLALPMYGLFEGGLLLARAFEHKPEPSSTT